MAVQHQLRAIPQHQHLRHRLRFVTARNAILGQTIAPLATTPIAATNAPSAAREEEQLNVDRRELQLTVDANFLAELVRLRDALRVEVDLIRLAEERPHCANLKNALTVGRELNEVTATCEIDSSATSVARASASCVFWLSSRSFMPSDAPQ